MTDSTIDFLLSFADDEHLMGQHHTEWIGVAPFLEEDLALSSIGQDELGHALMLYELVLELQGKEASDRAVDELAYRSADQYRSSALTEFSTTDWAETLVRHWIYDTVEARRWALFGESSIEPLRDIAAAVMREESFHQLHANALLDALLDHQEARTRLLEALDVVLPLVPSLLTPSASEAAALSAGVISASIADLADELVTTINSRFGVNVVLPAVPLTDRTRQQRSASFAPLMNRMREVLDYDPLATW